jgi:peptidoglycan/xylan/chitin deacetylase (PgdA/CDA1 family)
VAFRDAISAPPGRRIFSITFDDGFRSIESWAYQILTELDIPATVFVPTEYVGRATPMSWPGIDQWVDTEHSHELHPLDWDQLRFLDRAGWEVGSHTVSHARLTTLSDEALRHELGASLAKCEDEVQQPCSSIAYPYGDVDPRVARAAAAAGYRFGAALPARLHAPRSLEWPRVGVYHIDGDRRFALKTSPLGRRLRSSPVGSVLRRAMEPRHARVT